MKRAHRTAHWRIWLILGPLLPLILLLLMMLRETAPVDRPAIQIEPPAPQSHLQEHGPPVRLTQTGASPWL